MFDAEIAYALLILGVFLLFFILLKIVVDISKHKLNNTRDTSKKDKFNQECGYGWDYVIGMLLAQCMC
jgi:hypothetical protein